MSLALSMQRIHGSRALLKFRTQMVFEGFWKTKSMPNDFRQKGAYVLSAETGKPHNPPSMSGIGVPATLCVLRH